MNKVRRFIVYLLIIIIPLSTGGSANAQTDARYFPDTGHYVKGIFLQFYNSVNDPALVYGFPLTEQITARDGKTVQYFHKARFELTSDNRVKLTPLGRLMYSAQSPLPINSTNGCEQYPTGFSVCLDFLSFYKTNGGPNQFGNPISSFEYAPNGLLTQYFEGARFEWRANLGTNDWILITDLGRLYFDQQREDPAHLKPIQPPDATIKSVISIKSRAFVLKAVTLKNGSQTLHVIAQDQTLQAVPGAVITAIVNLSDGSKQELEFFTNQAGIGQTSFSFSDQKVGELITIDITVSYLGLSTTTTSSFRIWN